MNERQKRIAFFRHWAGYSTPPGRLMCAKALADAEIAAEKAEVRHEWEWDQDADDSFVDTWPPKDQKAWRDREHECLCCILYDADDNVLASLCGIFDPDSNYRRVVQAELDLECIEALRTLGDNI